MMKLTPMMQQYRKIKKETPPSILMFRLGDFYEMFFDDALTASRILNITLTSRESGKGNKVPMCGVPYHAVQEYIAKLVRAGHRVAVCDQVEDPELAKGLVKREVTRVVTPGTVLEESLLREKSNNYLAAINRANGLYGLCYLDLSTGEFVVAEIARETDLFNEVGRVAPSEFLLPLGLAEDKEFLRRVKESSFAMVNPLDDWLFEYESSYGRLKEFFHTQSLDGFGCSNLGPAIGAAGAVIHYLKETGHSSLAHVTKITRSINTDQMILDIYTQRNLELVRNLRSGGCEGTLISVLDHTSTSMGARLLRQWLLQPLIGVEDIVRRQGGVQELFDNAATSDALSKILKDFKDIERLIARIDCGHANARDLLALKQSVDLLPSLKECIAPLASEIIGGLRGTIENMSDISALIEKGIDPDAPLTVREGGVIRSGYDTELDEIRSIARSGKGWIVELQKREVERTGIRSLKVGYNRVFGYYIEVTKPNLGAAPADYIRKQTVVNGERFITLELKEYESKVLGAEEKAAAMEYTIFQRIREKIVAETERVQRVGRGVALLDLLNSLAVAARRNNYVRPEVNEGDVIEIIDGRHPVLELMLVDERFVPNDTLLNTETDQLLIITGPNMAGKSTYIRQVALLVLMAQTGSFIPATRATIGVVDRIFTRVGASDELTRGQSTFMVEMNETANILNNATEKSLIVLDEIGRGTSTFDGISIAWAVAEYLHNNTAVRARTLFATHYHELTELEMNLPGVKNYNVAVREWNDEIVFLRKIVPGGTDKSYGIHVARLAGLPRKVIERAKDILNALEEGCIREERLPRPEGAPPDQAGAQQLTLFEMRPHPVIEELKSIDVDKMSPIEALYRLKILQEKCREPH
ncbi:MAG: DNA mismatch repair protein MutS [Candidatus Aureabacteria bacterium]|nr:DNA mismatch repair protein MutS [Candidatus Auribacterota bacterium]